MTCDDRVRTVSKDLEPGPGLGIGDLRERVRRAAFALVLSEGRLVTPAQLASLVGVTEMALAPILDDLAKAGWIDRDPEGRVAGSAGLSLTDGPHALTIMGNRFRTWCAYDSIGIAAALRADAVIGTSCPVCARAIELETSEGHPPANRPERTWLAEGGTDLRADFCTPTVLLCSREHAAVWSERHLGRGRSVDLAEGAAMGAKAWAALADAAAALEERGR